MNNLHTEQNTIIDRLIERRVSFVLVFFLTFLFTYILLVAVDFVPEPKAADIEESESMPIEDLRLQAAEPKVEKVVMNEPVEPLRIYIEKLDKTIPVLNPTSRDVAVLDDALLSGAVRHPDSAKLGQQGNVFILGHSSYLPSVLNSSFQAFNGIQDLEWGDVIEVAGENEVFVYRVDKVYRAEAQELVVPIAGEKHRLTLATCDSFGTVNSRFIVEATQIESRAL